MLQGEIMSDYFDRRNSDMGSGSNGVNNRTYCNTSRWALGTAPRREVVALKAITWMFDYLQCVDVYTLKELSLLDQVKPNIDAPWVINDCRNVIAHFARMTLKNLSEG